MLALLASASSIPLNQEQTPSWVNICQGTYLFSEDTRSWNDAYGECELYGAHIAQIDSLAENFVCSTMRTQRDFQLIGTGTVLMTSCQKEFGVSMMRNCCHGHLGGLMRNRMEEKKGTVEGSVL